MTDNQKPSREEVIAYLEAEATRQLGYADERKLHKQTRADAYEAYRMYSEAAKLLRQEG